MPADNKGEGPQAEEIIRREGLYLSAADIQQGDEIITDKEGEKGLGCLSAKAWERELAFFRSEEFMTLLCMEIFAEFVCYGQFFWNTMPEPLRGLPQARSRIIQLTVVLPVIDFSSNRAERREDVTVEKGVECFDGTLVVRAEEFVDYFEKINGVGQGC